MEPEPRSSWPKNPIGSPRTHLCAFATPLFVPLIYYDQRIRREGYDLEHMMEEAGLNPTAQPVPNRSLPEPMSRPGQAGGPGAIRPSWHASAVLAVCALLPLTGLAAQQVPGPVISAGKTRPVTRDEYRSHLAALDALVRACAQTRDMKTCDPAQVGPDDLVPIAQAPNAERRLVRYGWLRVLLSKAQDKDAPLPKPKTEVSQAEQAWENVRPAPPTTTRLLIDAQSRLAADSAQAGSSAPALAPGHDAERAVLRQLLAGREYRDLEETTAKDSAYEKVGNWLNHLLESAVRASARAPWLGQALVWGFIAAVSIALLWGLLQLERRWRIRLVPEDRSPAPGSASAIPWQQWMEEARRAAQAGQWREAIHLLYWASISRLESKRLWPADRTRTPREYLALVAPDDPRQPGLVALTGSFERVWYGGRSAAEGDYRRAEQLATELISGASPGAGGGAPQ
jgi:hypothetical protein